MIEDLSEDEPLDPDEMDDALDDSDEGVASEAEREAIEHALTNCAW